MGRQEVLGPVKLLSTQATQAQARSAYHQLDTWMVRRIAMHQRPKVDTLALMQVRKGIDTHRATLRGVQTSRVAGTQHLRRPRLRTDILLRTIAATEGGDEQYLQGWKELVPIKKERSDCRLACFDR